MDALSRLTALFLLNALWQIALVTAIAMLLDRWLRSAPSRYRHLLWMMAVGAVIALPVASTRRRIADATASVVASAAADQALWPVPAPPLRPTRVSRAASARAFLRKAMAGAHPAIRIPRTPARDALALYAAFLVIMLVRFARAWLRTREIRRNASTAQDSPLATRRSPLAQTLAAVADPAGASILWSSEVPGPVTVGARHPTIILPLRLLDPAAEDDLKAALAHELAHVRRRDYLSNLLSELLLLPVAFHPVAWTIRRHLAESRELACDELAATALNPARYARSLVRMAHQISDLALPAAPGPDYTLGVFDADILEERVMRLLKPRARMRLAKCSLFCAALCIAASCVAAAAFSMAPAQAGQTGETNRISSGTVTGAVTGGVAGGVVGGVASGVPGGGNNSASTITGGVSGRAGGGVPVASTLTYTGREYSEATTGTLTGIVPAPRGQASADQQDEASSGEVSPYDNWLNQEVVYIITPSERTAFQKLTTNAERDEFIAQFWERRNPNPGSSPNVFKEEYYRRIAYANEHFKSSVRPGWKTDRGHMYIAYGPPDEIDDHDASKPHPFEVWRYNHVEGVGDGVSFMFVDEYGNGDFGLTTAPWNWPSQDKDPAVGQRKIRVGGAVAAAKLIEDTRGPLEYPESARKQGIEGPVTLEVTISAEGVPTEVKVVSSPDDSLSKAAIDAVRQWRYRPTLLNGEPIEVLTTVVVDYHLPN
jgi:TonB family protein